MGKKKQDKFGYVFSTDPEFQYEYSEEEDITLDAEEQKLVVYRDSHKRKGKTVTIISGFIGSREDIKSLEKKLKSACGVGGSSKDNEIIIQGDLREKILKLLKDYGYTKSKIN